ncbi:MAG: hypothetical protein K2P65_09820 [Lachnospiraceae bacterium]|nr:hypothetical protein [Lachnospiraceae bacterium]
MKKSSGIKIVVIGVILALIVVFYFYYTSHKMDDMSKEKDVASTRVQIVLMRDLEKEYPPTPKEVVKYFSEISQCFYSETYTDDELYDMAIQIQGLYDDELVANKSQEKYLEDLKSDIAMMKANDQSISSYQVSTSTDVEFFTEGTDSCAKLYCTYNIRQGTGKVSTRIVFILRQDADKHWKILGWDLDD